MPINIGPYIYLSPAGTQLRVYFGPTAVAVTVHFYVKQYFVDCFNSCSNVVVLLLLIVNCICTYGSVTHCTYACIPLLILFLSSFFLLVDIEADEDESSCLKSSLTKASGFNRLFSEVSSVCMSDFGTVWNLLSISACPYLV